MYSSKAAYIAFLLATILLFLPQRGLADSRISVDVEPKEGTVSDVFVLTITLSGDTPNSPSPPVFEDDEHFRVESAGTTTQRSFSFGLTKSQNYSTTYSFNVFPSADLPPGRYELPRGTIEIRGKSYRLKRPSITILASDQQPQTTLSTVGVSFAQIVDSETPYVGQQITYRAVIGTRYRINAELSDPEWKGFWHESFGNQAKRERTVGDIQITSFLDALFPLREGPLEIGRRTLSAEISVFDPRDSGWPGSALDSFFPGIFWGSGDYKRVNKRFVAQPINVRVKSLPPPPFDFGQPILVGSLDLKSRVSGGSIKKGDSITLDMTLRGDANLRPLVLPKPEGPNAGDFRLYPEKPKVEAFVRGDKINFVKTFSVAFVPSKSGMMQLPSFSFLVFDPISKKYRTLRSQQKFINVLHDEGTPSPDVAAPSDSARIAKVDGNKHRVELLTQDLLPQHENPESLITERQLNSRTIMLVLFLAPLLGSFVLVFLKRRLELLDKPALAKQKRAFQKAISELDAINVDSLDVLDRLHQILVTYLSEQFVMEEGRITSSEIECCLDDRIGSFAKDRAELILDIRELLALFERLRFGRNRKVSVTTEDLIKKTNELIRRLRDALS